LSIWLTVVVSSAAVAVLAVGAFPAAARADLQATLELPSSAGGDLDLASFDIATRARLVGPGVNTSANEFHPSIAGNRLAFERIQGTNVLIIVRDISTGQQAVVLRGAILRGRPAPASDPALAPNGSVVITARAQNDSCRS
jgi:hypothetical protein